MPTLSSGMSPALEAVTREFGNDFEHPQMPSIKTSMVLSKLQQSIWERSRAIGAGGQAVVLTDGICAYLVGRIVNDLGLNRNFQKSLLICKNSTLAAMSSNFNWNVTIVELSLSDSSDLHPMRTRITHA